MKMNRVTSTDLINWWLLKYHSKTVDDVLHEFPDARESPEWFRVYAVTKEQHDEWHEWMKDTVAKQYHIPQKVIAKYTAFLYLNVAPSVITELL
jgi:hypothetical protein